MKFEKELAVVKAELIRFGNQLCASMNEDEYTVTEVGYKWPNYLPEFKITDKPEKIKRIVSLTYGSKANLSRESIYVFVALELAYRAMSKGEAVDVNYLNNGGGVNISSFLIRDSIPYSTEIYEPLLAAKEAYKKVQLRKLRELIPPFIFDTVEERLPTILFRAGEVSKEMQNNPPTTPYAGFNPHRGLDAFSTGNQIVAIGRTEAARARARFGEAVDIRKVLSDVNELDSVVSHFDPVTKAILIEYVLFHLAGHVFYNIDTWLDVKLAAEGVVHYTTAGKLSYKIK